jgi:DNA-binding transcriptional LysR family regulator
MFSIAPGNRCAVLIPTTCGRSSRWWRRGASPAPRSASTTALIYHLLPVLTRLRKRYPQLELIVTTGTTAGVVECMMRNEIDFGAKLARRRRRVIDGVRGAGIPRPARASA